MVIDKGIISAFKDNGNAAEVIPSTAKDSVTIPLLIPTLLKDTLKINSEVVYVTFDDNTGMILEYLGGYDLPVEPVCFQYTQETPSTAWTITHNLGRMPSIVVKDSNGEIVVGHYEYPDANTAVLTFSEAISGHACLN